VLDPVFRLLTVDLLPYHRGEPGGRPIPLFKYNGHLEIVIVYLQATIHDQEIRAIDCAKAGTPCSETLGAYTDVTTVVYSRNSATLWVTCDYRIGDLSPQVEARSVRDKSREDAARISNHYIPTVINDSRFFCWRWTSRCPVMKSDCANESNPHHSP
jgi:hypothetical protein